MEATLEDLEHRLASEKAEMAGKRKELDAQRDKQAEQVLPVPCFVFPLASNFLPDFPRRTVPAEGTAVGSSSGRRPTP